MAQDRKHDQVRSRNEPFVSSTATRIWHEQASMDNPYIAATVFCHGYDLAELMKKRSFVDVFYLLFRGELPKKSDAQLLQQLMIALINPGPRHPAVRAAMNAGVGKSDPVHILPIGSAVLGGSYMGGGEVESAMRFFRRYQKTNPQDLFNSLMLQIMDANVEEQSLLIPGFGSRYGGVELMAVALADQLLELEGAGKALTWGHQMNALLNQHGLGWTLTGVAAAAFSDMGFQPRYGGPLFQLLGAPGLVAHGIELANKPITAMPFVSDENYVVER